MSCGYTPPVNCVDPMCMVCQAFCETGSQYVSAYQGAANAPSIAKDDIVIKKLPKAEWQRLVTWVSTATKKGSKKDSGNWTPGPIPGNFISASATNDLINGLHMLNDASVPPNAAKDTSIVSASYFQQIMSSINAAQLDGDACDQCNTGCNIPCQTCITCNQCMYSTCSDAP